MSDFQLSSSLHEVACPHCHARTRHSSPAATILFCPAKCEHCGQEFLIVQNKPWLGDNVQNKPWLGGNGSNPQKS